MKAMDYCKNVRVLNIDEALIAKADEYVRQHNLYPWEAEKYYNEALRPLIEQSTGNLTPEEITFFSYENEEISFGQYTVYKAYIRRYMQAHGINDTVEGFLGSINDKAQQKVLYNAALAADAACLN